MSEIFIDGQHAEKILVELSTWGNVTTIILHGGSVFEFKGPFPVGSMGEGFYNLGSAEQGPASGFEGHINLSLITRIDFQERKHRGRDSHALVFNDKNKQPIFKVFVGREENGELIESQLTAFQSFKAL